LTYKGNWINDKYHGHGALYDYKKNDYYIGEFREGKRQSA